MYYFLPPDAVAPSPPLIPRRVSRSYENVKLKGQESVDKGVTTSVVSHPPRIPPRKGYENVELKESKKKKTEEKEEEEERGTENVATTASLRVNPPIPLKRARSPQPPKEYCPVTPPMPARRSREKAGAEDSKMTKLFKVASVPYCPVTPNSPQLPVRGESHSVSNLVTLPLEESADESANCDEPSPYYSLPPDSLSPMAEVDARFHIDDSGEEEEPEGGELDKDGEGGHLEVYLTLDEEIQSKARSGVRGKEEEEVEKVLKSPMQYCPPLPPKV